MDQQLKSDPPTSTSTSLDKIGRSLEKVGDRFHHFSDWLKRWATVGALAIACTLAIQVWLVTKSRANAERLAELAASQVAQQAELREIGQTTQETRVVVEEAKAEVAAAPKLEVTPPAKPGGQPKVNLVVPARPSKPATTATPSAAAVPSSAPAPAVSIPLSLPSASVVTTTTGGAP